jgi:hypothetical protein
MCYASVRESYGSVTDTGIKALHYPEPTETPMRLFLRYRPLDIYPDPIDARVAELHELAEDIHARHARKWRRHGTMLTLRDGADRRFPAGDPETRH